MEKYIKNVDVTFFEKDSEIDIGDALNEIVYLEVNSPLNYGVRVIKFYGRVVKVTDFYFEFLTYSQALTNDISTSQIDLLENRFKTKRWAKKSIQKLIKVNTFRKIVEREFYKVI